MNAEDPALHTHTLPAETVVRIQELYDRGLMLQAFALAQPFGPLSQWSGKGAQTLAARLASNLGDPRLGSVLHWRAWRKDKSNPDLGAYYGHVLLGRRGPLAVWEFLERQGFALDASPPDHLAHLFSLRAMVAGHLRDFSDAEQWLARAAKLAPEHPWIATTRSHVLELQDKYPEALEAAQQALRLRPWYRPAVQMVAHFLRILDRDQAALAFLTEASQHTESMDVTRRLAVLQKELGKYPEAALSLARSEELAPLMETDERLWLQGQRVTLACLGNDTATALQIAKQIDDPYYKTLADRLASGAPNGRVLLEVPFIRQHHLTCAPATLSAISRFWKTPAEHLEVAEAICYDGTPAHSERHWAQTHGWAVREFTVTWNAAIALLDNRIPFTLTTSEATSGHLQAVVGYDELRQTLWIRDPFVYGTNEFLVKPLLDRFKATGPRGMALVPIGENRLFDNLNLPDAGLYDELFQVHRALAEHRRAEAATICQQMETTAPNHRLTFTARRALAGYDSNTPALLECLTGLLQQFPEDGNLNLGKLACLRDLARREERLSLLRTLCSKRGIDPIFYQQYAQELRSDARQCAAAVNWVRWALRARPLDPDLISAWADLCWDKREFEQATKYYRLAACLGDKREQFARNFFVASRHLRQTESALRFLQERTDRLGARSSNPAITLIESLQHLGRTTESFQVLETALGRRPEDGSLRLFASDFNGRFGRFESAGKWLREAQDRCPPVNWHRGAARLADYQSDKTAALGHWLEVLKSEPLGHEAIRAITLLRAETQSRQAALDFLAELCARFPFSCPLLALQVHWLKEEGPAAAIPALRHLLEVNPADGWGRRELALQLAATTDSAGALSEAEEAIRLEPNLSFSYSTRAEILLRSGQMAEARTDFLHALRLEVDNGFAVVQYVTTAPTLAQRKLALSTVAQELRLQVIFSDALFAFQSAARGVLAPEEVLALLREAHEARPDLWQAWSVLIHQLIDTGKHEHARNLAVAASERFLLLPKTWLDLARAEHALLNLKGETAALEKALELNASYSDAVRQLALIYERQNELAKARTFLERIVVANPLDATNHGYLAEVLWKLGEREAALAKIEQALKLMPGYEWAWNALRTWGAELGRPGLAEEAARDLTRRRAGETRSWLMLARSLRPDTAAGEIFSALDRALTLNLRCEDAYDFRAQTLAQLNRFDEALAACAPVALKPIPAQLKLRAAWVEAQRGNLPKAISAAKAALEEHPDFLRGWQLLAEWYRKSDQLDEAVQAVERMAGLAPLDPVPLGYLGELKLQLGDRAGATASFQRAFTLDQDYTYAGLQVFWLHLAGRRLAQAEQTLQVLCRRGQTHETIACSVELAVAHQRPDRSLEQFRALCAFPKASEWSLAKAASALDNVSLTRSADRLIDEHLACPDPGMGLALLWVERQIRRGNWRLHSRLNRLKTEGAPGRAAILRYLEHLGTHLDATRQQKSVSKTLRLRYHFRRLFKKHRYWLQPDVQGWGKVGYVLTCVGRPGPVIAWLSDWKNRPQAESWMLYNLVVMLHRQGKFQEGLEIIRHAVRLRHGEDLHQVFRLWAAFEEALAGDVPLAERHLATLPLESIPEARRPLQVMTQLLIALQQKATDERPNTRAVRSRLRAAFGKKHPYQEDQYTRDGYARFIGVAMRQTGGVALRLWSLWYYREAAWIWIALAILCAPVVVLTPPLWIVAAWFWWRRSPPR